MIGEDTFGFHLCVQTKRINVYQWYTNSDGSV